MAHLCEERNNSLNVPANEAPKWTKENGKLLQDAVDRIFGQHEALLNLSFSFSIADPWLDGCPLIGCSTGFEQLTGYDMDQICGRNCRFLVDPVPPEQQDLKVRRLARELCQCTLNQKEFKVSDNDWESWMPHRMTGDELFCVQKNARKDGTFFNNMFYMKVFTLGQDLDDGRPYIVALQSELKEGKKDLAHLCKHTDLLDKNMSELEHVLSEVFFVQSSMRRQTVFGIDERMSGA